MGSSSPTRKMKTTTGYLVSLIVAFIGLQASNALRCYYCNNHYVTSDYYDSQCGSPDYNNADYVRENNEVGTYCYTKLQYGYTVRLQGVNTNVVDGDCTVIGSTSTECHCTSDLCNNNRCEQCAGPHQKTN